MIRSCHTSWNDRATVRNGPAISQEDPNVRTANDPAQATRTVRISLAIGHDAPFERCCLPGVISLTEHRSIAHSRFTRAAFPLVRYPIGTGRRYGREARRDHAGSFERFRSALRSVILEPRPRRQARPQASWPVRPQSGPKWPRAGIPVRMAQEWPLECGRNGP